MIAHPRENPPTLIGSTVTLRPTVLGDASAMMDATSYETFRYFVEFIPEAQTLAEFEKYVAYIIDNPSMLAFTVLLNETNSVIGSSCYLDIRPKDDHVEIGFTWFAEHVRGTKVNPEAKFLMLQYAFETLGCQKVTLKCDARNERSANAILKLGAKAEGQLRNHRFNHLGEWRDTAYFSILASEWEGVKSGLLERLK
jgi:RimJ/RimL family protein N-acetyltransferase